MDGTGVPDTVEANDTEISRSRPRFRDSITSTAASITSTEFPDYVIPKRPRVVKMRDLSETTKSRITREYFDVYDPWTGARIAATLGILISLFTLFLIYKGKYNKSRTSIIPTKKTSLYLYDEDLECDLDNLSSSDDSGSFAYSFRYGNNRLPHECHEAYPLEEVFVKSSVVERVALTVHKSRKNSRGPKYGTLRITKEASRSLPCSPYKQKKKNNEDAASQAEEADATAAKYLSSPTPPERPCSFSGSITSLSSSESSEGLIKTTVFSKPRDEAGLKSAKKSENDGDDVVSQPVTATKKPQDYRRRSTIVAIGRRKRRT